MKKKEHSVGWNAVKTLSKKIKTQRLIIVFLIFLYVISMIMAFTGGR